MCQDIEFSKLGFDELSQVCDADGITNVELMEENVGEAELSAENFDGVVPALLVSGGEDDDEALLGEEVDGGQADAFVGSCEHRAELFLLLTDALLRLPVFLSSVRCWKNTFFFIIIIIIIIHIFIINY